MQKIVAPYEGEPVFVLRAKDNAVFAAMTAYADECERLEAPEAHRREVNEVLNQMIEWRASNQTLCKVPD